MRYFSFEHMVFRIYCRANDQHGLNIMKVLYICTHNRCRSILSEAVTNHGGDGVLEAASAGSSPVDQVHPLSIKYLQARGMATEGLKSQSWDDLEAFEPDVVVTVCDRAANESCPVWFGKAIKQHWGLKDPSSMEGTDEEIEAAFHHTIDLIEARVNKLKAVANRVDVSDVDALRATLAELATESED